MGSSITALVTMAILLPAAFAGCVRPDEPPVKSEDCEGWSRYWCEEPPACDLSCCDDCCGGDCWGPPPVRCGGFGPTEDPAAYSSACGGCWDPYNSTYSGCPMPVPPAPLLDIIEPRVIAACDGCASASVATARGLIFVASEHGLTILARGDARTLDAPLDALPPVGWRLSGASLGLAAEAGGLRSAFSSSPTADADGRAWWATLTEADASAVPGFGDLGTQRALLLASWESGESWSSTRAILPEALPLLALAERAWVVGTQRELVIVLATQDAGWAYRSFDGGATFGLAESLTSPAGVAQVGAPILDAKDRVHVPYAWSASGAANGILGPMAAHQSLHFATLETSGMWTQHGGMGIEFPLAPGTRPSMDVSPEGDAFTWTDASGVARRLESWDGGMSYGSPAEWSDSGAVLATPAGQRAGALATLAWWEREDETARLVVARAGDGAPPMRQSVASVGSLPEAAALALTGSGRALVAWADGGALWLGAERAIPELEPCDVNAHCAPLDW